jgi:hypothetical protein
LPHIPATMMFCSGAWGHVTMSKKILWSHLVNGYHLSFPLLRWHSVLLWISSAFMSWVLFAKPPDLGKSPSLGFVYPIPIWCYSLWQLNLVSLA